MGSSKPQWPQPQAGQPALQIPTFHQTDPAGAAREAAGALDRQPSANANPFLSSGPMGGGTAPLPAPSQQSQAPAAGRMMQALGAQPRVGPAMPIGVDRSPGWLDRSVEAGHANGNIAPSNPRYTAPMSPYQRLQQFMGSATPALDASIALNGPRQVPADEQARYDAADARMAAIDPSKLPPTQYASADPADVHQNRGLQNFYAGLGIKPPDTGPNAQQRVAALQGQINSAPSAANLMRQSLQDQQGMRAMGTNMEGLSAARGMQRGLNQGPFRDDIDEYNGYRSQDRQNAVSADTMRQADLLRRRNGLEAGWVNPNPDSGYRTTRNPQEDQVKRQVYLNRILGSQAASQRGDVAETARLDPGTWQGATHSQGEQLSPLLQQRGYKINERGQIVDSTGAPADTFHLQMNRSLPVDVQQRMGLAGGANGADAIRANDARRAAMLAPAQQNVIAASMQKKFGPDGAALRSLQAGGGDETQRNNYTRIAGLLSPEEAATAADARGHVEVERIRANAQSDDPVLQYLQHLGPKGVVPPGAQPSITDWLRKKMQGATAGTQQATGQQEGKNITQDVDFNQPSYLNAKTPAAAIDAFSQQNPNATEEQKAAFREWYNGRFDAGARDRFDADHGSDERWGTFTSRATVNRRRAILGRQPIESKWQPSPPGDWGR
jgi:hypothetical protein